MKNIILSKMYRLAGINHDNTNESFNRFKDLKNILHEYRENSKHKGLLFEELSSLIEKELIIGDNLKRKLKNINKPFADKLLQYLTSDKIPDRVQIDSVDLTNKDDKTLTGFYTDKQGNKKEKQFRVGKLLDYLNIPVSDFKTYEIEELISYLKKGSIADFKIVDGDDILWAYHCDNYDEGETMGSCMRYASAQKYLDIYTNNPDDVKCLVLINPINKKVRGRALLFFMDNGQTFMDKPYTINKEYNYLFNQYADEKGYSRIPNSTVTLTNGGNYDYYPYLDTFMYYNPNKGVLSTSSDSDYIKLQDTSGGFQDPGTYIDYGDHEGEYVDDDDAIWLDYRYQGRYIHGYAHIDDVIFTHDEPYLTEHTVQLFNGDFAFLGDSDIYYIDKGRYKGHHGHIDDIVFLNDEVYDGQTTTLDDIKECDDEFYSNTFFMKEDTVETYNDKTIYKGDAVKLYPKHYGEDSLAHIDETTEVKIKGFGDTYILSYDLDEFEEKNLID